MTKQQDILKRINNLYYQIAKDSLSVERVQQYSDEIDALIETLETEEIKNKEEI